MYFEKVVLGYFHQGNEKFGDSAGKQCTCCSLFSVTFTHLKSPGHWSPSDLDFIVDSGDSIYKGLNKNTYLLMSELPRQISLLESSFTVEYKENKFGFIYCQSISGSFLDTNIPSDIDGLLILLKGLCISVTWNKRSYFLFDSHSKNENGECCADGYIQLY